MENKTNDKNNTEDFLGSVFFEDDTVDVFEESRRRLREISVDRFNVCEFKKKMKILQNLYVLFYSGRERIYARGLLFIFVNMRICLYLMNLMRL